MGWESSDVNRSGPGPLLLQGQTSTANLKMLRTCLSLVLEVCNVKPTYRKSWAGNLLMSDLTLGSFQGQTRIAKHKSAYKSFIIGPKGFGCENNL